MTVLLWILPRNSAQNFTHRQNHPNDFMKANFVPVSIAPTICQVLVYKGIVYKGHG